jgi:hypothetical protein
VLDVATPTNPSNSVVDCQGKSAANTHALNPAFLRQQLERSINGRQTGMDEFSHGRSTYNNHPATAQLHALNQRQDKLSGLWLTVNQPA